MAEEKVPQFFDLGVHEVCRFSNGDWSLRMKQGDDRAHVRYLTEFEADLLLAGYRAALLSAPPSNPGDGKPVAYMQRFKDGRACFYELDPREVHDNGLPVTPLYAVWDERRKAMEAPEVTDAMYAAYHEALGETVRAAIEAGTAEALWRKRACGYRLTERQKCEARWKAMYAALSHRERGGE